MRTTISMNDDVLATAKRVAGARGQTLGEFLETTVVQFVTSEAQTPTRAIEIPVSPLAGGFAPGVDPMSNRSLSDAADGF